MAASTSGAPRRDRARQQLDGRRPRVVDPVAERERAGRRPASSKTTSYAPAAGRIAPATGWRLPYELAVRVDVERQRRRSRRGGSRRRRRRPAARRAPFVTTTPKFATGFASADAEDLLRAGERRRDAGSARVVGVAVDADAGLAARRVARVGARPAGAAPPGPPSCGARTKNQNGIRRASVAAGEDDEAGVLALRGRGADRQRDGQRRRARSPSAARRRRPPDRGSAARRPLTVQGPAPPPASVEVDRPRQRRGARPDEAEREPGRRREEERAVGAGKVDEAAALTRRRRLERGARRRGTPAAPSGRAPT